MSWIRTYTGRRFDPLNPDPKAIHMGDVAHSLSNICRYTGHTKEFYSVAQHSVLVAKIVKYLGGSPVEQFQGLLHDATEAYLNDVARPLKILPFMESYREIEGKIEHLIAAKFGLKSLTTELVKRADTIALATEARDLMGDPQDWEILKNVPRMPEPVVPQLPSQAKESFWYYYDRLRLGAGL
jgi:hypothetical protein